MKDRHSKHGHAPHKGGAEASEKQEAPSPVEAGAGAEPAAPLEQPSEQEVLKNQLLRLQADFDNYRKRTLREQAETGLRANENLCQELLPVLDHFEMGLKNAAELQTPPTVLEGLRLVYDQFAGALKKFGLEPVEAGNSPFDPHLHEAITYIPSPEIPAETVIEQTRRGYKLGDKLLRAAQVVVSSGPADEPPSESEGEE